MPRKKDPKKKYTTQCLNCGTDIEGWVCRPRKFCSLSCSTAYRNRGSVCSEETKRKIGEANKGRLIGKQNPSQRPEVRKKISLALKGRETPWNYKQRGVKRPQTSRALVKAYKDGRARIDKSAWGAGGYREDLGQYFRSRWEANFARILSLWGLSWQYEPAIFLLDISGVEYTYRPDFYLPNEGHYYEVKGYWTNIAKKKFEAFSKKHDVTLIDQEKYTELASLFRSKIPNWENSDGHPY